MTRSVSQHEWKLINQCAKKEYKRLTATTGLTLDWFVNAAYVGLIDRKQFARKWNVRYTWLSILSGIKRELRVEFDRKKQRDGRYITPLTFTDLDPNWTDTCGEEYNSYLDGLLARQTETTKDCENKELWDEVQSCLTSFEFVAVKMWADGHTNVETAKFLDNKISTVRYRRRAAIRKLQGSL
jgi:hypothetical protein